MTNLLEQPHTRPRLVAVVGGRRRPTLPAVSPVTAARRPTAPPAAARRPTAPATPVDRAAREANRLDRVRPRRRELHAVG